MNTQQIISEIRKLPFVEKKKVLHLLQEETAKILTEEEVQQTLYAAGFIGNLPNLAFYTDKDEDFEPIEISGEPISETIIKERS